MKVTTTRIPVEVTCDGEGLTSRAGSALLTGLSDRVGLTAGLVSGLRVHARAVAHEPGRIVRDIAVMLADGGDCLTDPGALRDQEVLFGPVASDTTAIRLGGVRPVGSCVRRDTRPARERLDTCAGRRW